MTWWTQKSMEMSVFLAYDVEKWEDLVKSGNALPGMPEEVKKISFLVTGCLAEGPQI